MARPTKEQALERDMRNRKFQFLEKILLVRPQIEDAIIDTALGKNKDANESKRLEMCRLLYDISDKYLQEQNKDIELAKEEDDIPVEDGKGKDDNIVDVNFG